MSIRDVGGQAHPLQQFRYALATFGTVRQAGVDQGVRDLVTNAAPRIQRAVRILKHHLEPRLTPRTRSTPQRMHRLTLEADLTTAGCHQADRGARQRRLAATSFTYQTHNLASLRAQTRSSYRAEHNPIAPEVLDLHVDQFENAHATRSGAYGSTVHATARPGVRSTNGGTSRRHLSAAYAQRG